MGRQYMGTSGSELDGDGTGSKEIEIGRRASGDGQTRGCDNDDSLTKIRS